METKKMLIQGMNGLEDAKRITQALRELIDFQQAILDQGYQVHV